MAENRRARSAEEPRSKARKPAGARGGRKGDGKKAGGKKGADRSGSGARGGYKGGGKKAGGKKGADRSGSGARGGKKAAKRSGAGPRRDGGGRRSGREDLAGPESWGRLARRGASGLERDTGGTGKERRTGSPAPESRDEPRYAGTRSDSPPADREARDQRRSRPNRDAIDDATAATIRARAEGAVARGRDRPARRRKPLPGRPRPPADPSATLVRRFGESKGRRMHRRLEAAARAFDAERYEEARAELVPLVKEAPELAEGRELMGLVRYRLGQWKQAVDELEAFRELTGSTEQHPVLADCHRALGHWADVDELWAELGQASPTAALVTEGRIVTAGARADRGDTLGAIRLLEQGWKLPKRPRPHHLRRAYALADLYERAGRSPRARELFRWVEAHAPDLADVRDRVRGLS